MYWESSTCPRCSHQIKPQNIIGKTMICSSCGWSDSVDWKKQKKKARLNTYLRYSAILLFVAGMGYFLNQYRVYGHDAVSLNAIKFQTLIGTNDSHDDQVLGEVCFKHNLIKCSEKALISASHKTELPAPSLVLLGRASYRLGNYQQSADAFARLDETPELLEGGLLEYGLSLEQLGQLEKSTQVLYRALSGNENNELVVESLVRVLSAQNKMTDAISVIGTYLFRFPAEEKKWKSRVDQLFAEAEKTEPLYNSSQIYLAGFNKKYHIPVEFPQISKTELFLISSKSEFMTLSTQFVKENGLKISRRLGRVKMNTSMNREIIGEKVILGQMRMGPWLLRNVQAVICKDCASVVGRSVLKTFKTEESKLSNTDLMALNIR